jgi:hypothetical protein
VLIAVLDESASPPLAGRGGVVSVEAAQREGEGVGLYELVAAVVRPRVLINADDVEPGPLVTLRRAARAAEQIGEPWLHAVLLLSNDRTPAVGLLP